MEDKSFQVCACCTRRLADEWVRNNGKDFCTDEHAAIYAEYLRLCDEARKEAKQFDKPGKKGEIDYQRAGEYLKKALGLPLTNAEPLPLATPALT